MEDTTIEKKIALVLLQSSIIGIDAWSKAYTEKKT